MFADVIKKAALSCQLFKDPECWSSRALNPQFPAQETRAFPAELARQWLGRQADSGFKFCYMCFILSLSGVEVIPEYWTSSRDVNKVLNTSPATSFVPNKLHNLVAGIFPSSHCLLAAFSALLIGARIDMKQGSQIRHIWRILRQNCSDDSTEVTEGVTSTRSLFVTENFWTSTPEIFGNKHSFFLIFFATNTIYVNCKRCKP